MPNKHVLITGGAGFIGSHLADTMLARGYEVTVLDCLLPQVHAGAETDADGWPVYLSRDVRRIYGNILDDGVFAGALRGVTHLVHLAASVGVGQSMTDIVDYTRNNTMGAAIILETLANGDHQVERISVASSMSIYGEGAYVASDGRAVAAPPRGRDQLAARDWELHDGGELLTPVATTEDKPLQPASIYAINKRDHEEMFLSIGQALGIPTIPLRLFNAYGSRQALSNPYTGVAAIFIGRLLADRAPMVFEDGLQMRDFVHVADVAEAFATVLDSEAQVWDVYNIGSGAPRTILSIAETLGRQLSNSHDPEILGKYRVGDIRHCFGDISKIHRDFGWAPRHDFESGMAELIDWVRHEARVEQASADALAANRMVI